MKIVLSLLAVLVVLAAITFGTLLSARHKERAFAALHTGDSKAQVLHTMGQPKQIWPCTEHPDPPANCASEFVYAHALAPAVPEYWVVRFDPTGRIVQTVQSTVRSSY